MSPDGPAPNTAAPNTAAPNTAAPNTAAQNGIHFAGWSTDAFAGPAASASLEALAATGARWVSVVVTQFQDSVDATTIGPGRATVSDAGVAGIIDEAHALGLRVSLTPHLNTATGAYRGTIGRTFGAEQWTAWFSSYGGALLHYADLAQGLGVEQLMVGTELEQASRQAVHWRSLVAAVRDRFSGTLTYAANHDGEEEAVTWWDAVDYIGVDAYYALDPSRPDYGWSPYLATLRALSARWHGQPVLVTEIGYRSVAGSPRRPWDAALAGPVDTEGQASAYAAALRAFAGERWLAGMYWWVWSPEIPNGPTDDGFSPQAKPAARRLAAYYGAS